MPRGFAVPFCYPQQDLRERVRDEPKEIFVDPPSKGGPAKNLYTKSELQSEMCLVSKGPFIQSTNTDTAEKENT